MVQGGVIVRCSTKYSKTAVILVCSLTSDVALLAGSFSIWTVACPRAVSAQSGHRAREHV